MFQHPEILVLDGVVHFVSRYGVLRPEKKADQFSSLSTEDSYSIRQGVFDRASNRGIDKLGADVSPCFRLPECKVLPWLLNTGPRRPSDFDFTKST